MLVQRYSDFEALEVQPQFPNVKKIGFISLCICLKKYYIFPSCVDIYRPPTKLREGNVFSRVCLSTRKGSHMIIIHDTLDLIVHPQPPNPGPSLLPLWIWDPTGHRDPLASDIWWLLKHVLSAQAGGTHPIGMLSGIFTARKRSLRRLCFYRCLSVHRGGWVSQNALQVT